MWARRTSTFFYLQWARQRGHSPHRHGPGGRRRARAGARPRGSHGAGAAAEQVRGTCTREGLNDILQYPLYFKLSDLPKEAGEGFIDLDWVVPIAHIETE